ncbi:MAG: hypothetical protein JW963_20420 [Anaerolineales bacterium]|nr:hypothetical protein [Anaerolineales bacterium]
MPKKEIKLTVKPIAFLKMQLLPSKATIIALYSIIAFMIYSWTLITFFYNLPSWMMYLTGKEIIIIFSYAMSIDLFESLMVLVGLLFLYLISPKALLKEDFAIRGTWLAIVYLGMLMLYFFPSLDIKQWIRNPWLWIVITFFVAILSAVFISRLSFMKKIALFLLDRMPAFLAIFIPISTVSLLILTIYLLF